MVEGPDRCGKSAISRALASSLSYTYFKNDAERREFGSGSDYFLGTLRYGLTYFLSFLRQSDVGVVFDRCYPSEYVYSKLFGRKTDEQLLWECDREFAQLGARIVVPYRSSYEGISDDSHPHLVGPKRLAELDALYREFATKTSVPTLFLNVDDEDLGREMRDIDLWMDIINRGALGETFTNNKISGFKDGI